MSLESRENYQWVLRIRENRVRTCPYWGPNILLKQNLLNVIVYLVKTVKFLRGGISSVLKCPPPSCKVGCSILSH